MYRDTLVPIHKAMVRWFRDKGVPIHQPDVNINKSLSESEYFPQIGCRLQAELGAPTNKLGAAHKRVFEACG